MHRELFEPERPWLEPQLGGSGWELNRQKWERQLGEWLQSYSKQICSRPVREDSPAALGYFARLWACWRQHCRSALEGEAKPSPTPEAVAVAIEHSEQPHARAASGRPEANTMNPFHVAAEIQAGRGFAGLGKLGGNPLRDVVLAEAVLQRDERATRLLLDEYQQFLTGLAFSQRRRSKKEPDDWWDDFIAHLAGYTAHEGKSTYFAEEVGVKRWLEVVASKVLGREGAEAERFQNALHKHLVGQARKQHPSAADPLASYWVGCAANFSGYAPPRHGALAAYQGKCGLRNFLGTVLKRFLARHIREGSDRRESDVEPPPDIEKPEAWLVSQECQRLVQDLVRQVLKNDAFKANEARLLLQLLVDGLQGKQVAAVMGIHPGNVSRRAESALDKLRELLGRLAQNVEFADCQRHLPRHEFAEVLTNTLRDHIESKNKPQGVPSGERGSRGGRS